MNVRSARRPWEAFGQRGRPRKELAGRAGCQWPMPAAGSNCGEQTVEGLLLCASHASVLEEPPGRTCAWPLCSQTAPFQVLCAYHVKRALGLLEPTQ